MIDDAILELIGAAEADALELTTDGQQLFLAPVKTVRDPPANVAARPSPSVTDVDCENPKESVRAIHVAQSLGFTQEHFRRIHHFGPKASIQAHVNHCLGTGRFTSKTNVIVCRRIVRSIELRDQGASWDDAIQSAVREHPFPHENQ
jgi:hypothetical protein